MEMINEEKNHHFLHTMAPFVSANLGLIIRIALSSIVFILFTSTKHVNGCYKSIVSFGDSLADTGNLLHLSGPSNKPLSFFLPPYGETYFNRPTGRCSDGRLVIDFIAESYGLEYIPPFIGGKIGPNGRNFSDGVNFAVAGATALEVSFFEGIGVSNPSTNVSLGTQLGWFREMLASSCQKTLAGCKEYFHNSLVLVGEIGGNDYNHAFLQGKSKEEVQSYVPTVIKAIGSALNELIELGAETLVVPGNLPIGCLASYLSYFRSLNKKDYDPTNGCLIWLNEFSVYHNELLQREIKRIQEIHPQSTIIYADYYNATMRFFRSPEKFGFKRTLRACCGGGGLYNYNSDVKCGNPLANTCDDPSLYICWDGLHLTEAAYSQITKALLRGPYTIPSINGMCNSLDKRDGIVASE